jgi:hypothetical protein
VFYYILTQTLIEYYIVVLYINKINILIQYYIVVLYINIKNTLIEFYIFVLHINTINLLTDYCSILLYIYTINTLIERFSVVLMGELVTNNDWTFRKICYSLKSVGFVEVFAKWSIPEFNEPPCCRGNGQRI